MANTKAMGRIRIPKNRMPVHKHTYPVTPKNEIKNSFIYHCGQEVTTSPEGVTTFAEAMEKIKKNYRGAWERLAKK